MPQRYFERLRHWFRTVITQSFVRSSRALKDQVRAEFHFQGQGGLRSWPRWRQWRYLTQVLTRREQRLLRVAAVMLLVSALFLANRLYYSFSDIVPATGGEYVEALVGSPQFINPVLAPANDVDLDITRLVFSGLVRYDQREGFVPDLAERFEVAPDGKTYTFYLRRDVRWHDDQPFTADDVIYTVQAIQNPKIKSPLLGSLAGVIVTKVDSATVRFNLSEPFAPFLSVLTVGILPDHLWSSVSPQQFGLMEYNLKPIGTGPYVFKNLKKDRQGAIHSYTLGAYARYHRGGPYITSLTLKFYGDGNEAADVLKTGSVDGMSFLSAAARANLKKQAGLNFHALVLPHYTALFFNSRKNPRLENNDLRLALATALDTNALVRAVLSDSAVALHGSLLPGTPGYGADDMTTAFDPVAPARRLDALGWKQVSADELRQRDAERRAKGGDIKDVARSAEVTPDPWAEQPLYRESQGTILSLTLTTVDRPDNQAVALAIQQQWRALGIRTVLEFIPPASIQRDVIEPRNYEVLLFGEILGPDPDPYPFWHSSQQSDGGLNLTSFGSRQIDNLLEEGRKQTDTAKRAQTYRDFGVALAKLAPAIFLYNPLYIYPQSTRIKGLSLERISVPADRFGEVQNWYINTKRQLRWLVRSK